MRYYREKLLLALLEQLESAVKGVQLQKLMFLLSDRQVSRSYDFMPYRFGCFSMQLHVDMSRLQDEGYIRPHPTKNVKNACEAVGIQYQHFPELGIVSDKRQSLNTQDDYDRLFDDYEISVLPNCRDALNQIYLLLQKDRRIALTCFEYDPNQYHRLRVANKLMSINQCNYKLINL